MQRAKGLRQFTIKMQKKNKEWIYAVANRSYFCYTHNVWFSIFFFRWLANSKYRVTRKHTQSFIKLFDGKMNEKYTMMLQDFLIRGQIKNCLEEFSAHFEYNARGNGM